MENLFEQTVYEVYALLDAENRVLRLDGGVSIKNVDATTWTKIDEGTEPLKYGNCQNNYVEMPLYTMDCICRYKYVDGECILRNDAEIQSDRDAIPAPVSEEDVTLEMLADHEERICMMEIMSEI